MINEDKSDSTKKLDVSLKLKNDFNWFALFI